MRNLNIIAEELFNKIRGRFPSVTIGNAEGKVTNIPKEARYYDFDFKDYVECAIMVTDDPREETVGVDYLIQPMPKKYITKEDSEDSNNKFCPSCLEQIIVPGNFCTNCGNKLI